MIFTTQRWLGVWLAVLSPLAQAQEAPGPERILLLPEAGTRVHGRFAFTAPGQLGSSPSSAGLGELLGRALLAGGAEGLSGAELQAWLVERSAELHLRWNAGELRFEFECGNDELADMIRYIGLLRSQPAYPEDVFATAKRAMIEDIERRHGDPGLLSTPALLTQALSAEHIPDATALSVGAIERAQLVAFHREALALERAWVALTGGFEEEAARSAIAEHLGTLPKRGIKAMRMTAPRPGLHAVVIDVPGALRSELRFSLEVHAGHPRFVDLLMLAEAFVQDPERNLDGRWALVPPSRLLPGLEPPLYLYRTLEEGDSIEDVLEGTLTLFDGIDHLDDETFERLLTGRMAVEQARAARPQIRMSRAIEAARHFPASRQPWTDVLDAIAELEFDDLERAAESLPAAPLKLIVVGPARAIVPALEPHMPVLRIGAGPSEPSTPEALALAERILDAVGGRDRWRLVRSLRTQSTVQVANVQAGITKSMDLEQHLLRVEQTTDGRTVTYVIAPKTAWRRDGIHVLDLPEAQAAGLRKRQLRARVSVLRELARGTTRTLRIGEGGRLELIGPRGVWVWILPGSDGRPQRLGYQLEGERLESVYLYSDWTESQGYHYPRHVHQLDRGTEIETTAFEVNPEFSAGLFERQ